MKIVLLASIGVITLGLMACSQDNIEKSPATSAAKAPLINGKKVKFHGEAGVSATAASTPLLMSLKKNHLEVSTTKNIGEAFDSYKYAIKKEWRETPVSGGSYYIDYICSLAISPVSSASLNEGVVTRELDIKFVVQEDGETYIAMASRVDIKSDGMRYTATLSPDEIKRTVTAIYENREITF